MKKAKNAKVNMKTLSAKIDRVNRELDEICDMLADLKTEKKPAKTVAKAKKAKTAKPKKKRAVKKKAKK